MEKTQNFPKVDVASVHGFEVNHFICEQNVLYQLQNLLKVFWGFQ